MRARGRPGDRRWSPTWSPKPGGRRPPASCSPPCARRCQSYMVPVGVRRARGMPLTPNGKVDRAALPAPRAAGPRAAYAAPRTARRTRSPAIWREIARGREVGRNDNFFDLGGHSLLARAGARRGCSERSAATIPLVDLFRHPTVALAGARSSSPRPEARAGEPGAARRPRRATPARRGDRHRRHGRPLPRAPRRRRVLAQPARRRRVDHLLHRRGAAGRRRRPEAARAIPGYVQAQRRARRRRPVRRRLLRLQPARGRADRPAAAALPGVRLGGPGERRLRPGDATRARIGVFAGVGHQHLLSSTSLSNPRARSTAVGAFQLAARPTTRTSWPRASPTSSTCTGRASTCRPPARPRWWPSTWPARACSRGECDMALAGGVSIRLPQTGRLPATRRAGSPRRTATAGPSTPAQRHRLRQRRRRRGAQAAERRAGATATPSTPSSGLGGQQRRRAQGRLHRAERRGTGGGDRRGARRWPASSPRRIGYVEAHGTGTAARRSDRGRRARARPSAPRPAGAASAPSARSRPTSATWTPPPASPA